MPDGFTIHVEVDRIYGLGPWAKRDIKRGGAMSSITKTIRLSGQAADSIEDAVRTVLARAASPPSRTFRTSGSWRSEARWTTQGCLPNSA